MAEIRVEQEKKRGLGWLWLLLIVALVLLAVWYFNNNNVDNVRTMRDVSGAATTLASATEALANSARAWLVAA